MDNIKEMLEEICITRKFLEVPSSSDLTKKEKDLVIDAFIKQKPIETVLFDILQSGFQNKISSLLVGLYSSRPHTYEVVSNKLVSEMREILYNKYDTDIDEILSDIYWDLKDDDLIENCGTIDYVFEKQRSFGISAYDPAYY